jgi:hypothetical protein
MNCDLDKNRYEVEQLIEKRDFFERQINLINVHLQERFWEAIVDEEGEVISYMDYAERHK